jgi:hypothetical protein
MFCPRCGTASPDGSAACSSCGAPQPQPVQELDQASVYMPPAAPADNTLGGLIPLKNPYALTAYYLAVFSLIPCLGLFLGFAALALGHKGRKYAVEHPDARGATHAWIGIILGGLCGLANLALMVLVVVGIIQSRR